MALRSLFLVAVLVLVCCASSLPSNFEYKTSLRGEQGFLGRVDSVKSAESLLAAGVVIDPALALRAALPDADVKVRQWGLRYFDADWTRYQVVLDADIGTGKTRTKCREVSSDGPVGAPTLRELRANDGAELQKQLKALVTACLLYANDLT